MTSHNQQSKKFIFKCNHWHVVFVQDCNMRCSYCATDFGRYGQPASVMSKDTADMLIQQTLMAAPDSKKIQFEFGGGETFLAFDEFIALIDAMTERLEEADCTASYTVTTNGTLLTKERLDILISRGVELAFSIDGPVEIHDQNRKDLSGEGSYAKALWAWKYYNNDEQRIAKKLSNTVQSVLSSESDIELITEFWNEQGQPFFNLTVELPSHFRKTDTADWKKRQSMFLDSLRKFANKKAEELDFPGFFSDYRGPVDLYKIWRGCFLDSKVSSCGAFHNMLAVDASGEIYPCEGFLGFEKWRIGSLSSGIEAATLSKYQAEHAAVISECATCQYAQACLGSCPASLPAIGINGSFQDSCHHAKEVAKIGIDSYAILSVKKIK